MQPGSTITPGITPTEPQNQEPQQPVQSQATQTPEAIADPAQTEQPVAIEAPVEPLQEQVFFNENKDLPDDAGSAPAIPSAESTPTVTWTASEFIAHDKNFGWYALVLLATIAVGSAVYFVTKDKVSPVVIVIMGIAFSVFGARKPRVLDYAISNAGVQVGQRHYPFGLFRTFSIIEEDAVRSILFMPMKRFSLPISIYYEPADEQKIIDTLSNYLPHEDRQAGSVDRLMSKIRF